MNKFSFWYCYLIIISILGMVFFLSGFFPLRLNSFGNADSHFIDVDELNVTGSLLHKRQIKRLIIMVIDGLRFDFVYGPSSPERMPFLHYLFENKKACLTKTKVEPPTVTMPRIKSLMSGTVSSFVDILFNFGSKALHVDNILKQANSAGMKTVFYGDDTWIHLFPSHFHRSNGTTSFFITDYTEVDDNVTYNLMNELDRVDWDIMILHYLGLDHIGHLEGPHSRLIKPKLIEMDYIISVIYEKLNLENKRSNDLLLVCGDHGMKDSGGHGGTTYGEIFVPLILTNFHCVTDHTKHIDQVDVAPLLSVMLGLTIPNESIGRLHYNLLPGDDKYKLFSLYYNCHHLAKMDIKEEEVTINFKNAESYFLNWFKGHRPPERIALLISLFESFQDIIKDHLSKNSGFDVISLMIAILIFIQVCFLLTLNLKPFFIWRNVPIALIFGIIIYATISLVVPIFLSEYIFSINSLMIFVPTFILSCNWFVTVDGYKMRPLWWDGFFLVCQFLYFISIFSSSLIEEEHQVWYFMFTSLCIFIFNYNRKDITFIMVSHKFFRCLNQTGDQWASIPDVGDWFAQNKLWLSFYHITSLSSIGYITTRKSNTSNAFLNIVTLGLVYLQKAAVGYCFFPLHFSFNGVVEFYVFLIFLFLKLFFELFLRRQTPGSNAYSSFLDFFIYFTAILYRPHNAMLLSSLIFYSSTLSELFRHNIIHLSIIHYWLGCVFYFYLGNSNSFSNIDIAPAYTGQTSYNIITVGCLLFFHTFSSFILSYILLIHNLIKFGSSLVNDLMKVFWTFLTIFSIQNLTCSILLFLQREHLFIWSVFAPKLIFVYIISILHYMLIFISISVIFIVKCLQRSLSIKKYDIIDKRRK